MGILVLTIAIVTAAQTTPVRDSASPGMAPGIIRGRVVAAADGRPLHRVRVTVNTQIPNPPSGVTDTRGIFEIAGVPAGAYSLTATRAGYLTIQYGQRRPREAGRMVEVRRGEATEGIEIALYRGGVLAGRVLDETGEPSAGARVEAVDQRYIRGRRVPVAARITTTNDAGEFRLSGLEPGAYQIRASSTEVWEADDGKETYVYALTYFPGVKERDEPQTIAVALGQEAAGLEFRLIAGRAARITGVLEDANGQPIAGQVVNMDRITRTIGGALQSAGFGGRTKSDARVSVESDWSFALKSLGGPFLFRVVGLPDGWDLRAVRLGDKDITDTAWDVPTGGKTISGLTIVATQRIGRVTGTVLDSRGKPTAAATVVVFSEDAEQWIPFSRLVRMARPTSDGRFTISGLPAGIYRAAAIQTVEDGQWEDRAFLESLRDTSSRFVLADGAVETLRLTLSDGR